MPPAASPHFARTCSGRPERHAPKVTRDGIIAVYIMASGRNGTLYTGVTSVLFDRVRQHKLGSFGFTKTYGCKALVWYEEHAGMLDAVGRKKRIKGAPRVEAGADRGR